MKHIYGPVPSRRLGFSLGLDLVPYKICSFDCVYCQLGKTTLKTVVRKIHVPYRKIIDELKDVLKQKKKIDYITISGSGEPTLNLDIGKLIYEIKKLTSIPVAVLTNSSLFSDPLLRKQILSSDLVVPSLDAVSPEVFRKIDRPHKSIKINEIVNGLVKFRKVYKGKIYLEIMLVKGINDNLKEIKKLKEALLKIKPDKIHLNLPVRPPQEKNIFPPDKEKLLKIKSLLGEKAEIIYLKKPGKEQSHTTDTEKEILELIKRRPVTLKDICDSLGLNENEAIKYTQVLIDNKLAKTKYYQERRYFIPK